MKTDVLYMKTNVLYMKTNVLHMKTNVHLSYFADYFNRGHPVVFEFWK